MIHELKCWPEPYDAIVDGRKPFEFRRDDRGYAVGDVLILRKWDPGAGPGGYYFSPGYPSTRVVVTYVLRGQFGLPPGYVVMGIAPESMQRSAGGRV